MYWLNQFDENAVPALDLNQALSRPSTKSFAGKMVHFRIGEELAGKLSFYGKVNGKTPYMILLAQLNVLLYCFSGCKQIVIGNPVSGRSRKEFENVVGLFVNTLPIYTRFTPETTFAELVEIVKNNTINAYVHELYPVDELTSDLNAGGNIGRSGLFDVMAQLQDQSIAAATDQVGDLKITPLPVSHVTSKFDLTFDFKINGSYIDVSIEYRTDLFLNNFIKSLKTDFIWLITHTLQDATLTVQNIRRNCLQKNKDLVDKAREFSENFR